MSTKKKILIVVLGIETVVIAAVIVFLFYMNSATVKANRQLELARRYFLEEDYEEAIAAFETAIEIDPRNEEAYLGLAEAYMAVDDVENAVKILERGSKRTDSEEILELLEEHNTQLAKKEEAAQKAADAEASQVSAEEVDETPSVTTGFITQDGEISYNESSLFDNEIQENGVNTKQIDLTQYLDIFADFYNVAGGYYSDETGDHENWVIGEGIQYGNYFESSCVDEIIISSSKYSLFGLYVGMSIENAKMCLNEWNIETGVDYSKGNMHIWLNIDENRMINEFGFWKDIQSESYLKSVLEKWQSGDYYGELIDENANREFVGKLSYGESYYYGGYDANGDRSGIGVAVYKIKHGNEGDFRSIYYLGEWKNGMREGVGEWVLEQSDYWGGGTSYCCKCNWINDFPEGSVSISWWSYDTYCAIEGTVSQGLFDNEIKIYNSSEKQNPMRYNYTKGYVHVNFVDESKGNYRYAVCVDDQNNIGYFEEGAVDSTHGIWGFADLIH